MTWSASAQRVLGRNRHWLEWAIPAVLCLILFGQLLFSSRRLSQTADEATHLYSGYRYLKCSDLTYSAEHPPLAKILAAAPLVPMNVQVDCTPFHGDDVTQAIIGLKWFYSIPDWQSAPFPLTGGSGGVRGRTLRAGLDSSTSDVRS